jgi:hypothetical protein
LRAALSFAKSAHHQQHSEPPLIFLTGDVMPPQDFQVFGRVIFALACLAMLGSGTMQMQRSRELRQLDTDAARSELAALKKRHLMFRISMLLIALISMKQG